jgi:hypothetical protein
VKKRGTKCSLCTCPILPHAEHVASLTHERLGKTLCPPFLRDEFEAESDAGLYSTECRLRASYIHRIPARSFPRSSLGSLSKFAVLFHRQKMFCPAYRPTNTNKQAMERAHDDAHVTEGLDHSNGLTFRLDLLVSSDHEFWLASHIFGTCNWA